MTGHGRLPTDGRGSWLTPSPLRGPPLPTTYHFAMPMQLGRFSARNGRCRRLGCSQGGESRWAPTPTAIVAAMSTSPPPATALPPPTALSGVDRRALVAILLGAGLASLDTAIANTALPAIAADLQAQLPGAIWIINAYQLTVVASLLPFAALADRVGARRVFIGVPGLHSRPSRCRAKVPDPNPHAIGTICQSGPAMRWASQLRSD